MLEFISYLVIFAVGFFVGETLFAYRIRHLIFKEAKAQGIDLDETAVTPKPVVEQLFVEKANNILYLYNKTNDTFVCQGNTLDELALLAKQYKNIKYAAVMIDKEIYAFVDGTVKSEKEVVK